MATKPQTKQSAKRPRMDRKWMNMGQARMRAMVKRSGPIAVANR